MSDTIIDCLHKYNQGRVEEEFADLLDAVETPLFETSNHMWSITDMVPLGSRGMAGAILFSGVASHTTTGAKIDCVVKQGPEGDGEMIAELTTLRACRTIDSPHGITMGGDPYYLGEWLDGGTGTRSLVFVRGGEDLAAKYGVDDWHALCTPQPLANAVQVAIGTLEAIAPLHKAGYIHTDMHPKNLLPLIADDGATIAGVAVIDFGAAVKIGSPARGRSWEYSAPEQWRHKEGVKSSRRTDAFAVAAVLYYLVTGKAPFKCKDDCLAVVEPPPEDNSFNPLLSRLETGLRATPAGYTAEQVEQILHNCGVDNDRGLRHLVWNALRPIGDRWSCAKLLEELKQLRRFLQALSP